MTLGVLESAADRLSESFFEALADSPEEAKLCKEMHDASLESVGMNGLN